MHIVYILTEVFFKLSLLFILLLEFVLEVED